MPPKITRTGLVYKEHYDSDLLEIADLSAQKVYTLQMGANSTLNDLITDGEPEFTYTGAYSISQPNNTNVSPANQSTDISEQTNSVGDSSNDIVSLPHRTQSDTITMYNKVQRGPYRLQANIDEKRYIHEIFHC